VVRRSSFGFGVRGSAFAVRRVNDERTKNPEPRKPTSNDEPRTT
jgi:hypothetical protein